MSLARELGLPGEANRDGGWPPRRRSPLKIPSSRASRRAYSMASSSETCSTRSTIERSRVSGMNPAPIPWILWGPGTRSWPASRLR
jgi:hypothetical protein